MNNFSSLKVSLFFLLLGCGDTAPNSKIHQLNPNAVIEITNTAEVSSTIFRKSGSDMYFCSSNSPDATFSKSSSNGISLTLVNFGDSVERDSYDSASSGDEMLGRTPAVLASRDILYRACELIGNLNLTPQEAVTFYRTALETAASLLAAETASTTVAQSSTLGIQVRETSTHSPNPPITDDEPVNNNSMTSDNTTEDYSSETNGN